LRELERTRQVPILFITASEVDAGQIAHGYALGAVDYILKPYTPEALQSKAAAYIDLGERTRRLQGQLEAAVGLQDRVNILVVNDNLASLLATEASLDKLRMPVHVVAAHSGREALSLLLKQTFALILLDVHMPDMDGFELAATLRQNERCRHTPLVFVTATCTAEVDVAAGYACGAIDFLLTPITTELLCAKVAAILDQFRQQRLLARQVDEITDLNRALHASARELENANVGLAERVRARTADLLKANEEFKIEIIERKAVEKELQQQTRALSAHNDELVRFHKAVVGGELRMIELKREVNELCRRLGEPPRHAMDQLQPDSVPGAGPAPAPPGGGGA